VPRDAASDDPSRPSAELQKGKGGWMQIRNLWSLPVLYFPLSSNDLYRPSEVTSYLLGHPCEEYAFAAKSLLSEPLLREGCSLVEEARQPLDFAFGELNALPKFFL
jgi:hypothetical protein